MKCDDVTPHGPHGWVRHGWHQGDRYPESCPGVGSGSPERPSLDNTRSAPERPDLVRLREGIGAHQAAAYIEHLEAELAARG